MIHGTTENSLNTSHPANRKLSNVSEGSNHESSTFHFVEGNPFTATLWAGDEGFHMTVNGRHETSYVYRQVSVSALYLEFPTDFIRTSSNEAYTLAET